MRANKSLATANNGNKKPNQIAKKPSSSRKKAARDRSGIDLGSASHDSEAIAQILTTVGMPEKCKKAGGVARFNPGVIGTETAVAAPKSAEKYVGAATTNKPSFGADAVFVLQRNAAAHQIHKVVPPTAQYWQYNAKFYTDDAPIGSDPVLNPKIDFMKPDAGVDLRPSNWVFNQGTWKVHGDMFLNAQSKLDPSKRWVFLNAGEKVKLRGTTGTNLTLKLVFYRYLSGGETQAYDQSENFTGGTEHSIIVDIDEAGYYRMVLYANDEGHITLTGGLDFHHLSGDADISQVYRHLCVQTYCENVWSWPELAVLGSTMRFQNNASLLSLQGDVTLADLPPGNFWLDNATADKISALSGREIFDARDGAQAKLALKIPDKDLGLVQYVALNGNKEISDSFWPLEQECPIVMMSVTIAEEAGRSCTIEVCDALEFRTTDQSRDTSAPEFSKLEWLSALEEYHLLPRFTKNSEHIDKFTSGLTNALKAITSSTIRYAPRIAQGAMTAAKVAAVVGALV